MKEVTTCIGCNKAPEEINEYIYYGKAEGMTPTEFVRREEGTFDCFEKTRFYCSVCYVKAGMPLRPVKRTL